MRLEPNTKIVLSVVMTLASLFVSACPAWVPTAAEIASFRCGDNKSCPPGQSCAADGYCVTISTDAAGNQADRGHSDAGMIDTREQDAAQADAQLPDAEISDLNHTDTQLSDNTSFDILPADSHAPDTQIGDTQVADSQIEDSQIADASQSDLNLADTSVPDTSVPDTSVPDTSVPDTSVPDTSVADTSQPDNYTPPDPVTISWATISNFYWNCAEQTHVNYYNNDNNVLLDVELQSGNWSNGYYESSTIDANNRDAWNDGGDLNLDICYFGNKDWNDHAGLQWSLNVPHCAKIIDAYISMNIQSQTNPNNIDYRVGIFVEDNANVAPFGENAWVTESTRHYSDQLRVEWIIPGSGLDSPTNSPPLTELVQHIVDGEDWNPSQYIGFKIEGIDNAGEINSSVALVDSSAANHNWQKSHFNYHYETYYSEGDISSEVQDSGTSNSQWFNFIWDADVPADTQLQVEYRTSDTDFRSDDSSPEWQTATASDGAGFSATGRYFQWRITFHAGCHTTPVLHEVHVSYQNP